MNREQWPTLQRAVDALRARAEHGTVMPFGRRKAARVLAEYERLQALVAGTPDQHVTMTWESAGGFYGWTCGCGAEGKGHFDPDDRDAQAAKHRAAPNMPACGHWVRGGDGEPIRTPRLDCGPCHEEAPRRP